MFYFPFYLYPRYFLLRQFLFSVPGGDLYFNIPFFYLVFLILCEDINLFFLNFRYLVLKENAFFI